jgi:tryptophan-rich hypothetical protein
MNNIAPKKLLNSKWTAVKPINKEKHFIITRVRYDETGAVSQCEIEAVLSRRQLSINWRDLKDTNSWQMGWH